MPKHKFPAVQWRKHGDEEEWTFGPVAAWALVIVIAILVTASLLAFGILKPADLRNIPFPTRPW